MFHKILPKLVISSVLIVGSLPQTAFAYIGPGSGLSAIGATLALVAGVAIAILGFIWYPIKRIMGKKKSQEPDQPDQANQESEETNDHNR